MAIKEQDKVFYEELANGDKVINLPITRVNNVEGLGRSANTAYVVGDIVYVDNNKKVALKCIQAGTTSNSELNVSTANIGDTVTDGSVVWQVCNRTSDVTSVNGKTGDVVVDLPVGHMYWSVEPNVPAGRLPAMGATYNRALYADLWTWANSVGLVKSESEWQAIASANGGNCAYYSSGDGSSTYRVPSIKWWIKGANGIEEVGSYLEAGLPNILGYVTSPAWLTFVNNTATGLTATGAFSETVKGGALAAAQNSNARDGGDLDIHFNAQKSNSIYGNSDTVQPPSIVGMWLIVAFGVAHNIGEADVANVMQAVEQVQTGLGTTNNKITGMTDYIIESYRNGYSWYDIYKGGKVRQGGYYSVSSGGSASYTVTLHKKMADNKYKAVCQIIAPNTFFSASPTTRNVSNMTVHTTGYGSSANHSGFFWEVEGQGA